MSTTKTILVIEDNYSTRLIIIEALKTQEFNILEARDGLNGVGLARQSHPDLIICDINMPTMDGYQVLESLRQDAVTATIPFIFLTAKRETAEIRVGMNRGADDYLTKPFTVAGLLGAVKARLEKQDLLARQNERRLNELRQSITTALPHELRTPLFLLLGYSDMIAKDYSDNDPELAEMADAINRSAGRLHHLTEKFLTYVEIESLALDQEAMAKLRFASTDDASAIVEASLKAVSKGATRETDAGLNLAPTPARIAPQHLRKLIQEILENAFKFSPPGTPVMVQTVRQNGSSVISVTDQGRGMTAEQIAQVGAYVQFDRAYYEQQGSGLGLSIARRLTELYGGALTIESTPGEGTTVTVALPASSSTQ